MSIHPRWPVMITLLLLLMLAPNVLAAPNPPQTRFRDPSFELDDGSWTTYTSVPGVSNLICISPICGGSPLYGPQSGAGYVWFGRTSDVETSYIEQQVLLPATYDLSMSFSVFVGSWDAASAPTLIVHVSTDAAPEIVFSYSPTGPEAYQNQTVSLNGYADGKIHTIRFSYVKSSGTTWSSISLDSFSLHKGGASLMASYDFENPGGSWTIVNGSTDKRKCNKPAKTFSYAGECAFVFTGGTTGTTILNLPFITFGRLPLPEVGAPRALNNVFYVGGWVKTTGTAKAKLIVKVEYDQVLPNYTSKIVLSSVGSFTWFQTEPITYATDYTLITRTAKITFSSTSGKVIVDEIESFQGLY
ncbi:MAG: hypothetical protein KA401_02610 [Anaerolineae bacterium]|nr:hypothetical protein [Chloroflexota bacterium]MBP6298213.1 hypothetical protein [Anaerolineae bacterium]